MPITVTTSLASAAELRTSVTQGGVTWTFTEAKLTRQTIDGAWIVQGPATLSDVTPAVSGTGVSLRNGLMVDPLWNLDPNYVGIAWDGRDTTQFDETLEASSFPLSISANQVLVKCVSKDPLSGSGDADRQGYPEESAALYIVSDISALPSGDVFSPSPMCWTGRSGFDWWTSRVDTAVAGLPSLDTSGHTNAVPYSSIADRINRFQAMAGFSTAMSNAGYQAWLMHATGDGNNYGQFVYKVQERAALGMLGNSWTTAQKRELMVSFASMGVHLMQLGTGASNYYSDMPIGIGGHMQWQQIPLDCAILSSADAPTTTLHERVVSNMLLQPFEFTQPLLDRLAPHTSSNDPMDYRERSVISVDTGTNTVRLDFGLGGERPRWKANTEKIMVSTDGSASSPIVGNTNFNTGGVIDVPVADASKFVGKTVYFDPVVPYSLGEISWNISNYRKYFSRFDLAPTTTYISDNNRWAGWVMFALANDLTDSQRLPAIRWTEQRAVGYRVQNLPFENAWAEEFWNDHASTLFAATVGGGGYNP